MNGGSEGDGLVGVDASGGLFAVEELLHELLDLGDTSGSADENDFVDLVLSQIRILKHLLHGLQSTAEEILGAGGNQTQRLSDIPDFDSRRLFSELC